MDSLWCLERSVGPTLGCDMRMHLFAVAFTGYRAGGYLDRLQKVWRVSTQVPKVPGLEGFLFVRAHCFENGVALEGGSKSLYPELVSQVEEEGQWFSFGLLSDPTHFLEHSAWECCERNGKIW